MLKGSQAMLIENGNFPLMRKLGKRLRAMKYGEKITMEFLLTAAGSSAQVVIHFK